jgi:LysR family transcriptional activator of nhaA
MQWLNYHHLLYFWTVARLGSVTEASAELRLAQPTVSAQVRLLEESLGEKLFVRSGRRLVLTEVGRLVYPYAEEIFSLGRQMVEAIRGSPRGRPLRLAIGVADVLPKMIVHRLLAPAFALAEPVQIVCREGKPDQLLAALSIHEIDLVLADTAIPPNLSVRAFHHLLGECSVTFFAAKPLARRLHRGFPGSLDGAPVLLPTEGSALRRSLEQWFASLGVRPRVVSEIEDSALLKAFGQTGMGAFPAPSPLEEEIQRQYRVQIVGRADAVRERFYAISVERKLKHPAVIAISKAARTDLFA